MSLMFGGALSAQLTSALMGEVANNGPNDNVTEVIMALLAEVADVIIPETDTPGACMTSVSCVNPSLTLMALTARAVGFAVGEMKKGDL